MSERELSEKVLFRLSQHFNILGEEVFGTFPQTIGRLRIDAVIAPKQKHLWKNPDVVFGLEFKDPSTQRIGGITRLIQQSYDYTRTDFDGFGYLPVIICPGVRPYFMKYPEKHVGRAVYDVISRMMGKMDIYELLNHKHDGYYIRHNGDHVIWSERRGVIEGKRMHCRVRFGNGNRGKNC